MSIQTQPAQTADPESYTLLLQLQGAGAGVIPVIPTTSNAHGITIARTSAGLYTLTFNEEPGPNFEGLDAAFGDTTNPVTVAGWSATSGVFTKRSATTKATLTFGTQNSTFAGADMAVTSYAFLQLCFKLGAPKL